MTDQRPEIEQIVIADIHGSKVGFVVDQVVGGHQAVIKSLGRMYRDVKGVSGATILGDGKLKQVDALLQLRNFTSNGEQFVALAI